MTGLAAGCWGRTAGPGANPETSAGRGALRGGQKGRHLRRQVPGTGGAEQAPGASRCAGKARKPRPASPRPAADRPRRRPRPAPSRPAPLDFRPELPRRLALRRRCRLGVGFGALGKTIRARLWLLPRPRQVPGGPLPCQVRAPRPGREAVPGPRGPALEAGAAGRARRQVSVGPGSAPEGRLGARRGRWPRPRADDPGGVCQALGPPGAAETLEPGPRRCRAVNPGSPFLASPPRAGPPGPLRPPWADAGRPAAQGSVRRRPLRPRGPLSPRCPRAFAGGRRGGRAHLQLRELHLPQGRPRAGGATAASSSQGTCLRSFGLQLTG